MRSFLTKLLLIFGVTFFISTGIFAQEPERKPKTNPCVSPLVQKAQKNGLRSLTLFEIPFYYRDMYYCKKSGQTLKRFDYIEDNQLEADVEKTKYLKGWTSTFVYLVGAGIVIYTVEQTISKL
ncbi:MAG: hypothetical protein H8E64_01600 [Candidatus Marinimicrobia bacterium]|nr:hypothetical protein [Candidatus Neomarinimicrobiota bacterium]